MLRLPRKTKRRRTKASLVARLPPTSIKVLQVLRLLHKTNLRCSECFACHAKRTGDAPSAAPATQHDTAPKSITRRQTSADLYEGIQVLRLPRKTKLRCSKCWVCHAKRTGDAPSVALATQNEAAPKSITRRQTSADLYEGAPSAAPATQDEKEMLQGCACQAKGDGAQKHQLSPDLRRPL